MSLQICLGRSLAILQLWHYDAAVDSRVIFKLALCREPKWWGFNFEHPYGGGLMWHFRFGKHRWAYVCRGPLERVY